MDTLPFTPSVPGTQCPRDNLLFAAVFGMDFYPFGLLFWTKPWYQRQLVAYVGKFLGLTEKCPSSPNTI
jgi:hypothetical protein